MMAFNAYAATFTGGVRVAVGDVNGDGLADIITGAGPGGGPHVKVFSGANTSELASFFAYDPSYTGGVYVSAGKLDADGKADFVVSPGPTATALPLNIYSGATLSLAHSIPLPPSPVEPTFTAVGGAVSTAPQYVNYARGRKLHTVDSAALAIIKSLYGDLPGDGTFAVGDVTGDGKPDVVSGNPSLPLVRVTTPDFAKRLFDKYPEGTTFRDGISVAVGDLNGDGVFDMVMGAGTGGSSHVKTCTGTDGSLMDSFSAFTATATFPVYVAAGDVNGDGKDDIITAAGAGGGPQVKVFQSGTQAVLRSFFAYDAAFTGGVRVAAGDVNGDGVADIVTGSGDGIASQVKVFSGTDLTVLRSFLPEAPGFTGGVYVAAGDVNGDGRADIVTGAGSGAPTVRVFDGATGVSIGTFLPYDPSFTGGVRVAVGDVNGDSVPEIICSPGPGAPPEVRCFDFPALQRVFTFQPYPATFTGGVFISSWTPAPASLIQSSAKRTSAGKMEITVQAPKGRTVYFDSTVNLVDWTPLESRPGTGLPLTFTATPPAGPDYFVRARAQ
jgi:hypothetical protein